MLRVAMLSKWHVHAEGYADSLLKTGKAEIVGVWDEDQQRGAQWAEKLGVSFEKDLDTLLSRKDIDAVVVDTPTTMHREVIIKSAEAGKHIFTEKALAPTVAECEEIAAAVKKAGVTFVISMPQRGFAAVQLAKKLINEGEFGKISCARIRNGHNGVSGNWLPDYWFDISTAAGGALMDLGCHPMYIATYLFGKPSKVSAALTSPLGDSQNEIKTRPVVMDESASVMIEFEGGEVVIGETSFISFASPEMLEIYGTDATFISCKGDVKFKSKTTARYTDDFITPKLPAALVSPIVKFVDACLNGTGCPQGLTVDDGVELTRILESCYISSRENRAVVL